MEAEFPAVQGDGGGQFVMRSRQGVICKSGSLLKLYFELGDKERGLYAQRFSLRRRDVEHGGLRLSYLGQKGREVQVVLSVKQAHLLSPNNSSEKEVDFDAVAILVEDKFTRLLRG